MKVICVNFAVIQIISIGGQSAVESRRHKKTETRVAVVDIVQLHGLKRQKKSLHVIRHIIAQEEQRGGRTVLFPFLVISDSKILGMMENKIQCF